MIQAFFHEIFGETFNMVCNKSNNIIVTKAFLTCLFIYIIHEDVYKLY